MLTKQFEITFWRSFLCQAIIEADVVGKQRDAGADVSALERELDELVYALYALTPEEIKLVESASAGAAARQGARPNESHS